MPAQYERIKESELSRGKSKQEAERIAAATYNKQHPGHSLAQWRKKHHERNRNRKRAHEAVLRHYHLKNAA